MNLEAKISPRYRSPLLIGASFQAGFLLLATLVFDFGQLFQWTLSAIVIYWITAGLIISRRPQMPTNWDLLLLRSGFLVILPASILLTSLIWMWRGLN